MVYTVDCVKTNTAEALEVLADAVLNPRFQPWDVADQVEKLAEDLKAIKQKPQTTVLEVRIHSPLPCPASRPIFNAYTCHEVQA